MIKVFPTGHVGVFLVGVKFLILFIGAVTHSQNMTSDRVREKKRREHGRMLTSRGWNGAECAEYCRMFCLFRCISFVQCQS